MSEPVSPEGQGPHFVNEVSALAEQRIHTMLETAKDLGVEMHSLEESEDTILEQIKSGHPERYELVAQKLSEQGISISDLPKKMMLDRMLGIDVLFSFQGKNYAVDVTTGKDTVLHNKRTKFEQMEELFKRLGIDRALVIRLKEDITDDIVLDLFSKLENLRDEEDVFTTVVKYPEKNGTQ